MDKVKFKYGDHKIDLSLPVDAVKLSVDEPLNNISREEFNISLNKLLPVSAGDSIGIIVSDKTRLCGYEIYLPWLTENLQKRGIQKKDIVFYIAYGTHPAQTESESLNAYGPTFREYSFIHHNCNDDKPLRSFGKTSRGTDIRVRKDIFDHDSLILFGAVSHHYFAGYGGGRKLIFPGLAAKEAIYHNHKLFIDFEAGKLDPGCQSGQLDGNPVAEDLREIDDLLPPKLIISGILNTAGKVAQLIFNASYKEFVETCKIYDSSYRCSSREQYDLVIASAGGYPKDINFIQTHKSLHNAATFVKDGGSLILLGECRDGIGNDVFMDIFGGSIDSIVRDLKSNYSGNGGTALATLTKSSRINVMMMTELEAAVCEKMNIRLIQQDQIKDKIRMAKGSTAYIENASIIF